MTVLAVVAVAAPACGSDDPTGPEPDPVRSVVVTSPIEDVMAVGRSVALDAVAEDASGNAIPGKAFTWRSSDDTVASVNDNGRVQGLSTGRTGITAEVDGVSGSLEMRVVAAELEQVSTLLEDVFTDRLVSKLGDAPRGVVGTALDDCSSALDAGYILALDACLMEIRDESATEPTDRALLAVLRLIAARAGLFLNL